MSILKGFPQEESTPVVSVNDLNRPMAYAGQTHLAPYDYSIFDGGKFWGGFGDTQVHQVDYWTLRARSVQLFNENLYAKGIVRRLVTNEINTGLTPALSPDENVLGLQEGYLTDWSEAVENRFTLWAKSRKACCHKGQETFGSIQRTARIESLIAGDVLVVLRYNPDQKTTSVQLVSGQLVRTPLASSSNLTRGHQIKHGVEFDAQHTVVAYWIMQDDLSYERLPAYGSKTGRRLAWLVYGTEKRLDEIRGQPLLSIVLQSLKEIDRYRDSAQRKAVINSIIAVFIKKNSDKPGSLPLMSGSLKRGQSEVTDNTTGSTPRRLNVAEYLPGTTFDELQEGEEIQTKGGEGTDVNFEIFEAAVLRSIGWANELPPEIMTLKFSSNYSASQAAMNEFLIYLNKFWGKWGEEFSTPIFTDWLISETLAGRIKDLGLLKAWRNEANYDQLAAWACCDWYGAVKPSTDPVKQARGAQIRVNEGWSTNAIEARKMTGTDFSKNMKRLSRENALKAEAMRPLLELRSQYVNTSQDPSSASAFDEILAKLEGIEDVASSS